MILKYVEVIDTVPETAFVSAVPAGTVGYINESEHAPEGKVAVTFLPNDLGYEESDEDESTVTVYIFKNNVREVSIK